VVCTDERYKVGGVWRLDGRRDKITLKYLFYKGRLSLYKDPAEAAAAVSFNQSFACACYFINYNTSKPV